MKLNLGCGFRKQPGYINIDLDPLCRPDQVLNLEETPWPFEDNSVDEILADHTLEHIGATPSVWLAIWKEIWRVCKPDAQVIIAVPHPRHDNFITDPTHVRPVMPGTIAMLDQTRNIRDFENGGQETKLGLMNGVDLDLQEVAFELNEPWASAQAQQRISKDDLQRDLAVLNNVCVQIRMRVRIVKPQRGADWIQAKLAHD